MTTNLHVNPERAMFHGPKFFCQRSEIAMDPLSDIIALLHPHDCVAAGLDAGGDWSIRFEAHAGLKCNAVLKGRCWLSVEGGAGPIRLKAGDCVVLPHGRPFVISTFAARRSADADTIYGGVPHGGTAVYGGGGDFFMTGSRFLLSGPAAEVLLRSLPPVIIVRSGPEQEAVQWALDRIAAELRAPRPGGGLSISHLSHFLFVQVMRRHLAEASPDMDGWLAAIADPQLCPAVAAMHQDPALPWTVQDLASRAGMSRTSFAVRFRHITGQTPLGYLTQWRMMLAAERLGRSGNPVARVAEEVGYASESAFAVAFKREMGQPPRRYLRATDIAMTPSSAIPVLSTMPEA
jgi:AraC-like DNA-binding protein